MKYILGVLITFLCAISVSQAQYTDSLWQVESNAKQMYAMPLFHNRFIDDIKNNISQTQENMYSYSWVNDSIIEISYSKPTNLNSWPAIHFNTISWEGDTTNKYTKNILGDNIKHKIAYGYTINMSPKSQRQISFYVQANEPIVLLGTLMDIQGKVSNSVEAKVNIDQTIGGVDLDDDSKWVRIIMSWDPSIVTSGDNGSMQDDYSDTWHGRSNMGYRDNIHNIDSSNISTLCFYADPAGFGTTNLNKTFYIRDLQIGNFDYDLVWQVEDNTIKLTEVPLLAQSTQDVSIHITDADQYTSTLNNEYLEVNFTNKAVSNITNSVELNLASFKGNTLMPFKTDTMGVPVNHDTLIGYSINFSDRENRIMRFQVQSDSDLDLLTNLIDLNDKHSNYDSPLLSITATQGGIDVTDNVKWKTYTIAWDADIESDAKALHMIDSLQKEWWNINNNGNRNNIHYIDSTGVIGFEFIIDPTNEEELGKSKRIVIRNIVLGNKAFYDIPDQNFNFNKQAISIDLNLYYHGGFNPSFSANSNNSEISYSINNGILTLNTLELCYDYTQVIELNCSDLNGTYTQSFSNTYTKHELKSPQIQGVSVGNNGISINWNDDNNEAIDKYTVYRKDSGSDFVNIVETDNNTYQFFDDNTDLHNLQYRYYVVSTDICQNESTRSGTHGSILLEYFKEGTLTHLSWNSYLGSNVLAYNVYASNRKGEMVFLKELTSLERSYIVKVDSSSNYYIEALLEENMHSFSNTIDVPTNIASITSKLDVYPTLFKNYINISSELHEYRARLMDSKGKVIIESNSNRLDTSNIVSGVYYLIIYRNDKLLNTTKLIKK